MFLVTCHSRVNIPASLTFLKLDLSKGKQVFIFPCCKKFLSTIFHQWFIFFFLVLEFTSFSNMIESFFCSVIHKLKWRQVWPTLVDSFPLQNFSRTTYDFRFLLKLDLSEGKKVLIFRFPKLITPLQQTQVSLLQCCISPIRKTSRCFGWFLFVNKSFTCLLSSLLKISPLLVFLNNLISSFESLTFLNRLFELL